jgi:hypothetical protein
MNKSLQYLLLALFYIIAYVYAIEIAPVLPHIDIPIAKKINSIHESCVVKCDATADLVGLGRGSTYFIGKDNNPAEMNKCAITFWGMSHYLFYSIAGFVFPDLFIETFLIGIGFELYEKHAFDCHDSLDIVLNSLGFASGWLIRRKIFDKIFN